MNHLISLSRQELIDKTDRLVSEERHVTAALLQNLREVERRGLHLEEGYGSLFAWLTKRYHFSEASAARRVAAMRLLKDAPALEGSIEQGTLNLGTASQVQVFFERERKQGKPYTVEQKTELVQKLAPLSQRECERELLKRSPEKALPKEKAKPITATHTEIRFTADETLVEKLGRLRELWSHHGVLTYAELVERLADLALKKADAATQSSRKKAVEIEEIRTREGGVKVQGGGDSEASAKIQTDMEVQTIEPQRSTSPAPEDFPPPSSSLPSQETPPPLPRPGRPYIRVEDKRAIWGRAEGRCEYLDPKTGRRCDSQWQLQLDHCVPLAQGGVHERANLRLACRNHNVWFAVQAFGPTVMQRYLRK